MPDPKAPAPKTSSFTVAKGRSLVVDVVTDGVTQATPKGPGETVDLSEAEGKRLVGLGFLLNPDGAQVVSAGGPPTENGVSITEK